MEMDAIRTFFLWCTILNAGLLIFTAAVCSFAKDWVYRLHSAFFQLSPAAFNTTLYGFIGAMKIIVLMFNLVPYLALLIAGH
ncbi:MAG TPA: hypothetical protein ENN97_06600 [Phycisphaerales bacterium]|nr:hypothetical protein [Phycisphaerales bacterium]